MSIEVNFCPRCGSRGIEREIKNKVSCKKCKYSLYYNIKLAAGIICFCSNLCLFLIFHRDFVKFSIHVYIGRLMNMSSIFVRFYFVIRHILKIYGEQWDKSRKKSLLPL
jgi:ribosomal protein S27AE